MKYSEAVKQAAFGTALSRGFGNVIQAVREQKRYQEEKAEREKENLMQYLRYTLPYATPEQARMIYQTHNVPNDIQNIFMPIVGVQQNKRLPEDVSKFYGFDPSEMMGRDEYYQIMRGYQDDIRMQENQERPKITYKQAVDTYNQIADVKDKEIFKQQIKDEFGWDLYKTKTKEYAPRTGTTAGERAAGDQLQILTGKRRALQIKLKEITAMDIEAGAVDKKQYEDDMAQLDRIETAITKLGENPNVPFEPDEWNKLILGEEKTDTKNAAKKLLKELINRLSKKK